MIISCPGCGSRVSNKHAVCPHCGTALDAAIDDGISADEAQRRRRLLRRGRIELQSYLSILIMVAGASWGFVSSDYLEYPVPFWPMAVTSTGALWYLGVRVYGIFVR